MTYYIKIRIFMAVLRGIIILVGNGCFYILNIYISYVLYLYLLTLNFLAINILNLTL